ncbi:MAG: amidohydrolase family protein [Chloroflexota bacterium]
MPDKIAIRGSWVYAWSAERNVAEVLRDRAVLVEGDRIAAILPADWHNDGSARELGGPGAFVIPGLINAHVHSAVTPPVRGVAEDDDRDATMLGLVVPVIKAVFEMLQADEIQPLVEWGQLELMRTGVTTVLESSNHDPEILVASAKHVGVRSYVSPLYGEQTPRGKYHILWGDQGDPDHSIAANVDLFTKYENANGGRIRGIFGLHAPDTCTEPFLKKIVRAADELDAPMMIHLNQTERERVTVAEREGGLSPAEYLQRVGMLRPGLLAAHNTYATPSDAALMASCGATAVYLPYILSRRGQPSPLPMLLEAGVNVALGTDSYCGDFVSLMKVGAYLGKQASRRPGLPTARQMLDAATAGAARGLRRDDIGRIAPGAQADVAVVDLATTTAAPVFDPVKSVVYYSSGLDVRHLLVAGQVLLEDGRFTTVDEAAIRRRNEEVCARVWQAVLGTTAGPA